MHKLPKKKRNRCKISESTINKQLNNDLSDESRDGIYEIKNSEILGRYVVAAKNLQAGSLIIREKPLIVGPCPSTPPICLNCHQSLPIDIFLCPGCQWPLCGRNCAGSWHNTVECSALTKSKPTSTDTPYQIISPLRCLLLEEIDPEKWEVLMRMEQHDEGRKKCKDRWDEEGREIVDKISKKLGFERFTEEKIRAVCGILQVNAFEVGQQGVSLLALYPRAYLLAHDCTPNTTHTDNEHTCLLTIRASTPISKGQTITLSYTYTLQGTTSRRLHLHQGKFFWCRCLRCSDPTELGTHASSMRCPRCREGWVLSTNPLQENSNWECQNKDCPGYSISGQTVKILMEKISNEVDAIDGNDVKEYESFLTRYHNVLHPQHYHFLGVKHSLSQLYGRSSNFLIHKLSTNLLQRKLELCRELLRSFDVLEPGYSRLRGTTLYELHAPLMMLSTRDFEANHISKQDLRKRLQEVVSCLQESVSILDLEPDNSQEKIMASAAKDALYRMRDWEKILGKFF